MKIKLIRSLFISCILSVGMCFLVSEMPSISPNKSNRSDYNDENKSIEGAIRSFYSLRLNEITGTVEPEWVNAAIAQADALKLKRRAQKPVKWEGMGPDNVGGRVRAFLMHRDSVNLWFAGGVAGGLFRSSSQGQSWYPVNDKQENLNVTCIAQSITGIIFYGTGEGGFVNLTGTRSGSPAFLGSGLFKSSDHRGVSFSQMTNTKSASFTVCNSMVAHPTEDKIYTATGDGIYEFTANGTVQKKLYNGSIKHLRIDINGVLWASSNNGTVLKMISGSMKRTGAPVTGGVTSIGISPSDPNYVYLLGSSGDNSFGGLSRTTDGGTTWNTLVVKTSFNDIFGSNRQGNYDNVISVNPSNKESVIMGGVILATWDNVNGFLGKASTYNAPSNTSYIHADKHVIEWDTRTSPPTIIVGTDGGLFRSKDGGTQWTPINRGFTTLQLYNVAANELGYIVGGAQDNGTQLISYTGNAFGGKPSKNAIEIYGGDGFDVEFSRFSPKTVFVSTYYGNVARSGNNGQSSSTFWDERQPGTTKTAFNTTYTLWESSAKISRLFLAKNSEIWMANNPTDFSEPVSWYMLASGLGNDDIKEMDYSADGDHLFFCKSGRIFRLDSINAATFTLAANPIVLVVPKPITLSNITPSGASGRSISSVNVDQMNANHVVVTLGGYGNTSYVYETNNALSSPPVWKNITGTMPLIPVYDAVIDVDNNKRIILATELGVYTTEDGGVNWEEANDGMCRTPVYEIRAYEWRPWEGMTMYIGSHGRGFFRSRSLLTSTYNAKDNLSLKLNAYPNPTNDLLTLSVQSKISQNAILTLLNVQGKVILEKTVLVTNGDNQFELNLGAFPKGYYYARLKGNAVQGTVKVCIH